MSKTVLAARVRVQTCGIKNRNLQHHSGIGYENWIEKLGFIFIS